MEPRKKRSVGKKILYGILFLFLAIVLIGACSTGTEETDPVVDTEKEVAEKPKEEEVKKEEKAPAPDTVPFNQPGQAGDLEVKVLSTETMTNVGGEYGTNSQGTYLAVAIEVSNKGTSETFVDSSQFVLKDGEMEYGSDGTAGIYGNEDAGLFLSQLNPGLTLTGTLYFDLGDEALASETKKLFISKGLFSSKGTSFDLK